MMRALIIALIALLGTGPAQAAVLDFEVRVDASALPADRRDKAVDDAIRVLLHRIDEIGGRNPRVERRSGDRVRVFLPRLEDNPATIKALLLRPARFAFHKVLWSGPPAEARSQPIPPGGAIATVEEGQGASPLAHILGKAEIVGGVAQARVVVDQFGPKIDLKLDPAATKAFADLTRAEIGKPIAMVLDGAVLSAPVVRDAITGGQVQITGRFEKREAERLAVLIRSGGLPTPLIDLSAPTATAPPLVAVPDHMRRESRHALLVGNAKYATVPSLANPVNDVRDMAAALRKAGFATTIIENAGRERMMEAIDEFGRKIGGSGIALFFYAGHAVQVKGANYLLPIDAALKAEAEVAYRAVDAGFVLAQFESARPRVGVLLLDACRDNPLPARARSAGASRGLAVVDRAPGGTVIAYATGPGDTAADGEGRNGLFTSELLKVIPEPGLKFEDGFKRVVAGVRQRSSGQQIPWITGSLEGDLYLTLPR